VGYPAPDVASNLEVATGTPWLFDQPAAAIVFPSDALLARRPQSLALKSERLLSSIDVEVMSKLESPETPAGKIRAIVSLRLLDGLTDIDGAAQMMQMSNRTLQRHLDREGLSYRSLVTQVRMDRAVRLVKEAHAPLKRISSDLGYSDPAHFTRAFSAQFGCSPSVLRKRR
jgi:AraC-like DNA-binding protein